MQEVLHALLMLNDVYYASPQDVYEEARQLVEERIQRELPGFTIAHAIEIGIVGAGDTQYHHGGVAHVLLPLSQNT